MINTIFINMPVVDLKKSTAFFKELGFSFYDPFTGEDSACMIIGEDKFAMLTSRPKFEQMIDKKVADKGTSEVLISLGCESADRVRHLSETAFAQGARKMNEAEDIGFMFSWGFEDLDGHIWDLFWMDPERLPQK